MPAAYAMPEIHVGQTVLWRSAPGERPGPATVTHVGDHTINVAIHVDAFKDHVLRTGVRHAGDPELRRLSGHDAGTWEHTAWDARVLRLLAELEGGGPAKKDGGK